MYGHPNVDKYGSGLKVGAPCLTPEMNRFLYFVGVTLAWREFPTAMGVSEFRHFRHFHWPRAAPRARWRKWVARWPDRQEPQDQVS